MATSIRNFDLNLLRIFDAIFTERSVSLAAARLGLSQPVVSNALTRMRRVCADDLFVRTSHGMQPTPYATSMAGTVHSALTKLAQALENSGEFEPATTTRQFRLALGDVASHIVLPTLLKAVAVEAPQVRIRILSLSHSKIAEALQSGQAELVIGGQGRPAESVYQQKLYTDSVVCVMRREHPLAQGQLTMRSYEKAQHVVTMSPLYIGEIIDTVGGRYRPKEADKLETPYLLSLPSILAATDLLALVSETTAHHLFPEPTFISKSLPFPRSPVSSFQYWHARYHRDLGVKWIRDLIYQIFKRQHAGGQSRFI